MLCEESNKLISLSVTIGYVSNKYTDGWEYFCLYKGSIYYIIDDGTESGMANDSKAVKVSKGQAMKIIKEIVHDEWKQNNAFRILGINVNDIHIQ